MNKNTKIEKESLLLIWRTKNLRPRLFIRELNSLTVTEFKKLLSIHNRYLNNSKKWDELYENSLSKEEEKILKEFKSGLDYDDSCDEDCKGWFESEWNCDSTDPICNYNVNVIICCGE